MKSSSALIDASGLQHRLRCAPPRRRKTGALLVSIGSHTPGFHVFYLKYLRVAERTRRGDRDAVGPQAQRGGPVAATALQLNARAYSRTHRAADLCVTAGYTSSTPLSFSPIIFYFSFRALPALRGAACPPSLLVSRRRGEQRSRSDRRASQSRRRWTRLCALIKYYARLTECRARKRRDSCSFF